MGLSAEGGGGGGRGGSDLSCHMESSLCGGREVIDGGERQHVVTSEHLHCAVSLCLRMDCSDKPSRTRVRAAYPALSAGRRTNLQNFGPKSVVVVGPFSRSGEFHAHVANKQSNQPHQTTTDVCWLEPNAAYCTSIFMPAAGGTAVGKTHAHQSINVGGFQAASCLSSPASALFCLLQAVVLTYS